MRQFLHMKQIQVQLQQTALIPSLTRAIESALTGFPVELLTENVFTNPQNTANNHINMRLHNLMLELSKQVYRTILQHDHFETKNESGRIVIDKMMHQMFFNRKLERTMHMFALMLSYGLIDSKKLTKTNNPTLHQLLALADAIMAQQYVQNRLIDKKNEVLRNGEEHKVSIEELWGYRSHIIHNLIGNLQIKSEIMQKIRQIYEKMNLKAVQAGQVFDAVLLRLENHEKTLDQIIEEFEKDGYKVPGLSSIVVVEVLNQMKELDPLRATIKLWFDGGRIFDLRYEYINAQYFTGLNDIVYTIAGEKDNDLRDALHELYTYYGRISQRGNDFGDLVFESNGKSKNMKIDRDADLRNHMITEWFYLLSELKSPQSPIRTVMTSLLGDVAHDITESLEGLPDTLTGMFALSQEVLADYFINSGLGLYVQQKCLQDWSTGKQTLANLMNDASGNYKLGKDLALLLTYPLKTNNRAVINIMARQRLVSPNAFKRALGASIKNQQRTIFHVLNVDTIDMMHPFYGDHTRYSIQDPKKQVHNFYSCLAEVARCLLPEADLDYTKTHNNELNFARLYVVLADLSSTYYQCCPTRPLIPTKQSADRRTVFR